MGRYAFAYLATGIAFALIDSVWLRTMSERLYKVEIGELLADSFRLPPAIVLGNSVGGGAAVRLAARRPATGTEYSAKPSIRL